MRLTDLQGAHFLLEEGHTWYLPENQSAGAGARDVESGREEEAACGDAGELDYPAQIMGCWQRTRRLSCLFA